MCCVQVLRCQADLDSAHAVADDLRAEVVALRHALELAQAALPAKELQVLKTRDELDTMHNHLTTAANEKRQLESALTLSRERQQELQADVSVSFVSTLLRVHWLLLCVVVR